MTDFITTFIVMWFHKAYEHILTSIDFVVEKLAFFFQIIRLLILFKKKHPSFRLFQRWYKFTFPDIYTALYIQTLLINFVGR